MTTITVFIIRLFCIKLCAKLGSKRVIGGFDGAIWGIFFSIFGIIIVMASRRLDDYKANIALLEKYAPADKVI